MTKTLQNFILSVLGTAFHGYMPIDAGKMIASSQINYEKELNCCKTLF